MTELEITAAREEFIGLCRAHINRSGLDELLDYLDRRTDFFTAPSSTRFHLNERGGLCRHSINVFRTLTAFYEAAVGPAIQAGTSPFAEEVPAESLAVVALFHDVCKANFYHPVERWRKDESGRWESYADYEVKDAFPFGHGEKSCLILNWFLRLSPDELLAIRWHMGLFEMSEPTSSGRASYRAAMGMSPLVSLLQAADMVASNCLEHIVTA